MVKQPQSGIISEMEPGSFRLKVRTILSTYHIAWSIRPYRASATAWSPVAMVIILCSSTAESQGP
jgi:hypothetical protein